MTKFRRFCKLKFMSKTQKMIFAIWHICQNWRNWISKRNNLKLTAYDKGSLLFESFQHDSTITHPDYSTKHYTNVSATNSEGWLQKGHLTWLRSRIKQKWLIKGVRIIWFDCIWTSGKPVLRTDPGERTDTDWNMTRLWRRSGLVLNFQC